MGKLSLLFGPLAAGMLAVVLLNDYRLGVTFFVALAANNIISARR